jgi:vWA-MoxR associated protein middle region (VMAP-M) 8/Trypsin-like peptidase domain
MRQASTALARKNQHILSAARKGNKRDSLMKVQTAWRARVDSPDGMTLGAGFLISATEVLMCAHTVYGRADVLVMFPSSSDSLTAKIERVTAWERANDRGDIALLRLQALVEIAPARLADGLTGPLKLRSYGFRRGHELAGTYIDLRGDADITLQEEWWQLGVDPGTSECLEAGFSGAGVYLRDTGEVIGMLTDADVQAGGLLGRILPVSTIRRYWEDIDDLLELLWLPSDDRKDLHAIVCSIPPSVPLTQVYREAFPDPSAAPTFSSAWDAIRYVAEERYGEDRLVGFLDNLIVNIQVVESWPCVSA